jgi:hypothetical protein
LFGDLFGCLKASKSNEAGLTALKSHRFFKNRIAFKKNEDGDRVT